jgi:hypothetical protein
MVNLSAQTGSERPTRRDTRGASGSPRDVGFEPNTELLESAQDLLDTLQDFESSLPEDPGGSSPGDPPGGENPPSGDPPQEDPPGGENPPSEDPPQEDPPGGQTPPQEDPPQEAGLGGTGLLLLLGAAGGAAYVATRSQTDTDG